MNKLIALNKDRYILVMETITDEEEAKDLIEKIATWWEKKGLSLITLYNMGLEVIDLRKEA